MAAFNASGLSKLIARLLNFAILIPMCGITQGEKPLSTKSREQVPEQNRWNTAALYPSSEKWKEDLLKIRSQDTSPYWPEFKTYQGKLKDPHFLEKFFDTYFGVERKLVKLHTYAHLRFDEDLGNDTSKSDYGLISTLIHAFQLESAWIEPELFGLSNEEYNRLISHPSLKNYHFYLEKIGRRREHTLPAAMEELVALSGKALDTAYKAFAALNNADLTFPPALDAQGKEHPLSNGSYQSYLKNSDRELRKNAFLNLHRGYDSHANTLCELIQGQVQSHFFIAKARKFHHCVEAALHADAIDPSVYTQLIQTVRKHLPSLHAYVALRKKALGLSEIHLYDLFVPLVAETKVELSYPDACKAVVDSVAPLGESYQKALEKGLMQDRWVDVFETTRKKSGAYSSGCYDSMPYILMNYHGTFGDVITLAHEAGHSMHSFLSRKNQPYIYSDYSIFVAEVASTFNEQLLLQFMKAKAKTTQEKAYFINDEIERIRGTIFVQTLFAEFELQLHKWAEEGIPFTPALLKEYYLKLHREYYGEDIALDPELAIGWARIPHFYRNFYVYQYATGLSASMALFQKAMSSSEAKEKYLAFLSSGGSDHPLHLLQKAGVDMRSKEPVDAALNKFRTLVEELERSL